MKILKRILAVVLLLIGVLLLISFFLPSMVHVQRSMVMNAPTEVVFDQINTLKNWEKWSPWLKMDPETKLTYNDKPSGAGASYSWVGKKTGEGTMTIQYIKPNESIITLLDFKGQGQSTGGFNFIPTKEGVEVVWFFDMNCGLNPIMKYMGKIMTGMMEKQFDDGLNGIKQIAERMPKSEPPMASPAAADSTMHQ